MESMVEALLESRSAHPETTVVRCGQRLDSGSVSEIASASVEIEVPQEFVVRTIDLTFIDRRLEIEFLLDYRNANLGHWRLCHLLSIFFFSIYAGLMSIMMQAHQVVFLWVGFGLVAPMFLIGLAISYTRIYTSNWQLINAGYVVVSGVAALVISAEAGTEHGFIGLTGFLFCFLFCYAVIRLRFVPASLAGTTLTIIFLAVAPTIVGSDVIALWLGIFFVVSFNLLGLLIAYVFELSTRRDYHSRLLVEQERTRVAAINQDLEIRVEERTEDLARRHQSLLDEMDRRRQAELERSELEVRYQQAQRMESVGRLAGGIAHDFNNLLTVINGYADWAVDALREGDPLRADIEEISKAGARATELTRQLLAFSRRQVLEPVVLDLNETVGALERTLQRIIGEDIDLQTNLSHAIGRVSADPGQIEQILMNLAVNARDAMPSGGRLIIETAEVVLGDDFVATHPGSSTGPHIILAVSDNGHGMTSEVRERIFEPFFTTKEKGQGTGLGLATVYGVVKQSGGSIWVDAEPGKGTRRCWS